MGKLQVVGRGFRSASLLVRAAYQAVDFNGKWVFLYHTIDYVHMIGSRVLARSDDSIRVGSAEMKRNPVINGEARRDTAAEQKSMIRRTTLSLSVVVRTATPR